MLKPYGRQWTFDHTDATIKEILQGHLPGEPFTWPFHTKREPQHRIRMLTDRADIAPDRRARLMCLAILRYVDVYLHKVRSNIRFAARLAHNSSGNGRLRQAPPKTMVTVVEIYRLAHNWIGPVVF